MEKSLLIGVTGGIGSGKSTFCNIAQKAGYPILFADDISKKFLGTDPVVKSKLIKRLGTQSYSNGKPNKDFIADKIFSSPEILKFVNSVLHPPTIDYIVNESNLLLQSYLLVFVESAILFEAKMDDIFDLIVLVKSETDLQINRVKKRNNLTEEKIHLILNSQLPDENKESKCDFVINNIKGIDDLEEKSKFVLGLIENLTRIEMDADQP
ncbi:MAG: dephospho-CoA kinase [Melioribacteraceae bacterium]|nr:dephospho-CoA kinase [Melioribacteraceae bacterium]